MRRVWGGVGAGPPAPTPGAGTYRFVFDRLSVVAGAEELNPETGWIF